MFTQGKKRAQGCQNWPQIGSDWPQMWQIWRTKMYGNWSLKVSDFFFRIGVNMTKFVANRYIPDLLTSYAHTVGLFFLCFFSLFFSVSHGVFLLTLIPLPPSLCCFIYKYKPHSSMTFPQQNPRQFFPHSLQGSWISYFGPKWVNLAIMGQIYDFLRSNLRTVWLRK